MEQETNLRWGLGRRKCAVARVRLVPGEGKIIINGKSLDEFTTRKLHKDEVQLPLAVTDSLGRWDVLAKVHGGGIGGQIGAVKLGIARALVEVDPELRGKLRNSGCVTRDPRMKERKKYGQKRARKRFQFSKR